MQKDGKTKGKRIAAAATVLAFLTIVSFVLVFCVALPVSEGARTDMVLCVTPGEPQKASDKYAVSRPDGYAVSEPDKYSVSTPEGSGGDVALSVYDDDMVWSTGAKVNIFEHGDPHVGSDGTGKANHVIAPGTSNDYIFTLRSDKNADIRYKVQVRGTSDSGYYLPVDVELFNSDGTSLTNGSVNIEELNAEVGGMLAGYGERQYRLSWKWDFERDDDAYDTMLGNAAVAAELACMIDISVVAEYISLPDSSESRVIESSDPVESSTPSTVSDPDKPASKSVSEPESEPESRPDSSAPQPSDSPVITGDSRNLLLPAAVIVLSAVIAATALKKRSSRKRTDDEE